MLAKKKIAICFFGITRSLKYTIGSIEENILNPARTLGDVRVFAHFFNQERVENSRSRESTALDRSEYKLLKPDCVVLEAPDECLSRHEFEKLKSFGDTRHDKFQSLRNIVHALHSLEQVTDMALEWAPDVVLFLRPDLFYHSSLEAIIQQALDSEAPAVFLPDWQHWRGGYNDRFAICVGKKAAITYGKRVQKMHEYCELYQEPLHSESLNRFALDTSGVSIKFFPERASRIRADGSQKREVWKEPLFDRFKTVIRSRRRASRSRAKNTPHPKP